jgi:hypothetical protein
MGWFDRPEPRTVGIVRRYVQSRRARARVRRATAPRLASQKPIVTVAAAAVR